MPEVKAQRDMKIIMSLTEDEAEKLYGLLLWAAEPNEKDLSKIEAELGLILRGDGSPNRYRFAYDEDSGYFHLED